MPHLQFWHRRDTLSEKQTAEGVPDQTYLVSLFSEAAQTAHQPGKDAVMSLTQCGIREKLWRVSRFRNPPAKQQQRQARASEAMNQQDSHISEGSAD